MKKDAGDIFIILYLAVVAASAIFLAKYERNTSTIIPSEPVSHHSSGANIIVSMVIFIFILALVYFLYKKIKERKVNERELILKRQDEKLQKSIKHEDKRNTIYLNSLVKTVLDESLDHGVRAEAFVRMMLNGRNASHLLGADVYINVRNLAIENYDEWAHNKEFIKAFRQSKHLVVHLKLIEDGYNRELFEET